jgi:hypothetical protein
LAFPGSEVNRWIACVLATKSAQKPLSMIPKSGRSLPRMVCRVQRVHHRLTGRRRGDVAVTLVHWLRQNENVLREMPP